MSSSAERLTAARLGMDPANVHDRAPALRPTDFGLECVRRYAEALGAETGVIITEEVAARIASAGFAYVGVSLDGTREKHDAFRGEAGAFRAVAAASAALYTVLAKFVPCHTVTAAPVAHLLVPAEGPVVAGLFVSMNGVDP